MVTDAVRAKLMTSLKYHSIHSRFWAKAAILVVNVKATQAGDRVNVITQFTYKTNMKFQ